MRADSPPLSRFPASTDVLNIRVAPNFQTRPELDFSFANQAAENRRCIVEANHSPHLQKGLCMLHRLPAARVHQESFSDLDGGHRKNPGVQELQEFRKK